MKFSVKVSRMHTSANVFLSFFFFLSFFCQEPEMDTLLHCLAIDYKNNNGSIEPQVKLNLTKSKSTLPLAIGLLEDIYK